MGPQGSVYESIRTIPGVASVLSEHEGRNEECEADVGYECYSTVSWKRTEVIRKNITNMTQEISYELSEAYPNYELLHQVKRSKLGESYEIMNVVKNVQYIQKNSDEKNSTAGLMDSFVQKLEQVMSNVMSRDNGSSGRIRNAENIECCKEKIRDPEDMTVPHYVMDYWRRKLADGSAERRQ
jgi:hypothetical protein